MNYNKSKCKEQWKDTFERNSLPIVHKTSSAIICMSSTTS